MPRAPQAIQWIRQAFVSLVGGDTETHPQVQATENGKSYQAVRLTPYGFNSNPPKGSIALVLVPSYGGEDTKYIIANDHPSRFKGLKEGEVSVGHYETRAEIFFDNDGNINIRVPNGNLIATVSGNITATAGGSATLTTGGDTTVNAPNVILNTTECRVSGLLRVLGGITGGADGGGQPINIFGDINQSQGNVSFAGGTVTHNGTDIGDTHIHSGVTVGAGNTGTPV